MKEPSITMRDFFALQSVKDAQEAQKRNAYGTEAHRKAHEAIREIAKLYGAEAFIGSY